MSGTRTALDIRLYRDEDEPGVLALLGASLGGGPAGIRPPEYFRWKHLESPFGRSFMLVAESEGRIVGLRAFMRWEFTAGDRRFRAVRAVDTATHPAYQGRGIFSELTRAALDTLRHEADFVFNTPNEKSLPGYLKMGWNVVGTVPIFVHVRRPIRFAMRARSWRRATEVRDLPATTAPPASEVLAGDAFRDLLDRQETPAGFATPRDAAYLRWRYGRAPLLDYRAVAARLGGRLDGLAIFRVRPRGSLAEATIAESLTAGARGSTDSRLLRAAGRAARVDHVTCSFPARSAAHRAARRALFVRAPGGMTLVVNTLGHDLDPPPLDLASWALSLGDLEVF